MSFHCRSFSSITCAALEKCGLLLLSVCPLFNIGHFDSIDIFKADFFVVQLQKPIREVDFRYGTLRVNVMECTVEVHRYPIRFSSRMITSEFWTCCSSEMSCRSTRECRSSRSRSASCNPFIASKGINCFALSFRVIISCSVTSDHPVAFPLHCSS